MSQDLRSANDRDGWTEQGTFEVGPGVHRIPLPLPGDGLKAVNVYAIEQAGGGVTLIDSGWGIGQAQEHLQAGLAALDRELGDITDIHCTHVHRDHYELGVALRRQFGSRLHLGLGEKPSLDDLAGGEPVNPEDSAMLTRLRLCGADAVIEQLRAARGKRRSTTVDWGVPDVWLQDGQQLTVADRTLRVLATPGHTQGHVVFVDDEAGVLFSGDHILPHITPSIGFEQVMVESALADFLASLALVRAMPDLEMLPAHGPVQPTTHHRIDELVAHHDHRLDLSQEAVELGATTTYEVARHIPWTRRETPFDDLDVFNQMLAVNETAAHLDVLVLRERLSATDVDGVRRYGV